MIDRQEASAGAGKAAIIITGAGESRRMGGIDKVFAPLCGHPLLYWSLKAAHSSHLVGQIVVVLSDRNLARGRDLVKERGFTKVSDICEGGERRQDSVLSGLNKVRAEWVLVQDAARPFLDASLIENGLSAAAETGAALAAVPVKDTIKVADEGLHIAGTPDRRTLWAAQTPQVFRFDIISAAYRLNVEATDDASLVERLGHRVKLYQGSYDNIKITTPEDLVLAEIIMKKRQCA